MQINNLTYQSLLINKKDSVSNAQSGSSSAAQSQFSTSSADAETETIDFTSMSRLDLQKMINRMTDSGQMSAKEGGDMATLTLDHYTALSMADPAFVSSNQMADMQNTYMNESVNFISTEQKYTTNDVQRGDAKSANFDTSVLATLLRLQGSKV